NWGTSLQRISDVNLEGRKRVSADRFTGTGGELNAVTHRTGSWSACGETLIDSSATSRSGIGLEAATHKTRQKIRDKNIQTPRITNNTVVILNSLASSQRAAAKLAQILENCAKNWLFHRHRVS